MVAAIATLTFLVGMAIGGVALWLIVGRRSAVAQEQAQLALSDRRVAEERLATKESALDELRVKNEQQGHLLDQRREENFQLKEQMAVLQTTLTKEREKLEEQARLLGEIKQQLPQVFQVVAAEALQRNTETFDKLYSQPVKTTLKEIENKITLVDNSATNLGVETSKLVKALQRPEVRGQWGEMHLRRVVELAGLVERCDFFEQQVISEGDSQLRPDLVVKLPGERNLAVDAKAPIQAFLDAAEAADESTRQAKLREFVAHVRERIKSLGGKAYHQNLDGSPEYVVLFLPTEAVFSAALSLDGELLEFAARYRVHLAGPTVLITLLRSAAYDWKQETLAKHAQEICELGRELYRRIATFGGHMAAVGKSLQSTVANYNKAVGSLEGNLMPQARRFEQIGAAPADKRLSDLEPIETIVRALQRTEFAESESVHEFEDDESLFSTR
jgi:DNA recombination protein RmuC